MFKDIGYLRSMTHNMMNGIAFLCVSSAVDLHRNRKNNIQHFIRNIRGQFWSMSTIKFFLP